MGKFSYTRFSHDGLRYLVAASGKKRSQDVLKNFSILPG